MRTARFPLVLFAALALAASAACGGDDDEAVTTVTAPAEPAASARPASRIERRLAAAGYHVAHSPVPPEIRGGRTFLTTGIGPMIVYIVEFRNAERAGAYARAVAATATGTPRQIVARRVGNTVYSGVVAERPDAVARVEPLVETVRKAEGRRARLIRLSPR